ncbi:MAG: hypothetical protein MHM6MM_000456 [Cercozoa sp. M6MM]
MSRRRKSAAQLLTDLPGIGKKTVERLNSCGVHTCEDLAALKDDDARRKKVLGGCGVAEWRLSRAITAASGKRRRTTMSSPDVSEVPTVAPSDDEFEQPPESPPELDDMQRALNSFDIREAPWPLPCRQDECQQIMAFLRRVVEERSGEVLYVAGKPGAGKTAALNGALRELEQREWSLRPVVVRRNAMEFSSGARLAQSILQELGHAKVSVTGAEEKLRRVAALTTGKGKRRRDQPMIILLLDEVDGLAQKDALRDMLSHTVHSRLALVAIANTLDLLDRYVSAFDAAELRTQSLAFMPYMPRHLLEITQNRFADVFGQPEALDRFFDRRALVLACRTVVKQSTDVRKLFALCRSALHAAHEAGDTQVSASCMRQVIEKERTPAFQAHLRKATTAERRVFFVLCMLLRQQQRKRGTTLRNLTTFMKYVSKHTTLQALPENQVQQVVTQLTQHSVLHTRRKNGLQVVELPAALQFSHVPRVIKREGDPDILSEQWMRLSDFIVPENYRVFH